LTVEDEIEFGIKNLGLSGTKKRVTNALELVGLKGYENREPHRLSQGQKQKLCVASVIATDPEVIVLDEPTSQLDYKNTKNIHEILKKLNKKGKTVILIEHDTDFLAEYCDRILIMDDGKIIRDDPTKKIFSQVNFLKKLGVKVPKRWVDEAKDKINALDNFLNFYCLPKGFARDKCFILECYSRFVVVEDPIWILWMD